MIQTYPVTFPLRVLLRSMDARKAKSSCEMENMGSDRSSYALRVNFAQTLYRVTMDGHRGGVSQEQFWKVDDQSLTTWDADAVVIHKCGYPYLDVIGNYFTCLVDDSREIDNCPNCGERLREDVEREEEKAFLTTPPACVGCSNYHGEIYKGIQFICAMHPNGVENDSNCNDYCRT